MRSIRANLIVWLTGTLALGVLTVAALTYALTRSQLSAVFDSELRQVASAVHLREDWIEQGRVRIARPGFFLSVRAYDETGRVYFETALPSLPQDAPLAFVGGFQDIDTDDGVWRVYTHIAPEGIVQVGQALATRNALARDITLELLMPLMLLMPVVILIAALVLKRGLAPLYETSRLVKTRDASQLDPLPAQHAPEELKPLVFQINALLARVAGSLDGQRRFLADVAHELRSPVAALALQVELAEEGGTQAMRAASFVELKRGIQRIQRQVQQLLDFARLDPGVQDPPIGTLDVAALAREVVGSHAAQAEEAGVDLGAETPARARVTGSEDELRSLIDNLVDNAIRYAPRDTAVTVSVRAATEHVEIEVADAGPGIPARERPRVFERFYRVAGDRTTGSGLGLAIVKAIVDRHRGRIDLEDAFPGAERPGLRVRVVLPAQARKTAPASAVTRAAAGAAHPAWSG